MTDAPIYTTDSYIGLLCQINHLRNDKIMSIDRKETILTAVIATADALGSAIKYRKVKAEIDLFDVKGVTRHLDKAMNTELLKSFFGDNELWIMEHQLNQIKKEIILTTKEISFDWQRLF